MTIIRQRAILLAVAAASLLGLSGAGAPADINRFILPPENARQAKTVHEISRATARQIIDNCIAFAQQNNVAVSIFILSPSGQIVAAERMDGQGPVNIETALMKAKTALYMRDSTHAWMNRTTENPDFAMRLIPLGQFWNSGGLPIVVNDILIGAIGVGGAAPGPQFSDEICAHRALTQVIGPQPPLAPNLPPRQQ
jgi:uncharacterized protein GlcG (DUF336 family)